ncbi:MAG TPA: hypothetical protein VMT00_10435 [Thermoanaerobaculia bacterium]|nr:hypothetical protein [Thermoanaerobaculia bacterium]
MQSLPSFKRTAVTLLAMLLGSASLAAGDALTLVPEDATTVAMVRVSDLRTSPITARLFEETDRLSVDGDAARFLAETGLEPAKDLDRIIVATRPGSDKEPNVLVAFEGRFDRNRIEEALAARGAVRKTSEHGLYFLLPESDDERPAIAFIDSSFGVAGSEASVVQALAAHAGGGTGFMSRSGLGREISRVERGATSWLLVDVQRAARHHGGPDWSDATKGRAGLLGPAMKTVAVLALWATDSGDALRFGGTAVSYDAETRQLLEDLLRGVLSGWRLAVQEKKPELLPVLRKFRVEQTSDAVIFTGSLPADVVKNWEAKKRSVARHALGEGAP